MVYVRSFVFSLRHCKAHRVIVENLLLLFIKQPFRSNIYVFYKCGVSLIFAINSEEAVKMSNNPLDHIPAGTPPPGVIPNLTDPPSKGDAIVILDGVFVSLMLVSVLIRVYVRLRLVKTWGWDDCKLP